MNYNILSHHSRSKHMGTEGNSVSIIPPPRSPRADHPNVHPAISSFGDELPRSHDLGEFNVISNRYHDNHEQREKNDLRKLKVGHTPHAARHTPHATRRTPRTARPDLTWPTQPS